ncbi:hypothetical protein DMENIID0001_112580 [Sergentomyia squamirostris]
MSNKYCSDLKIWSSSHNQCRKLFSDQMSLGQILLYSLSLNPEKICQINYDDDSQRTNGEIMDLTLKIAYNLTMMGFKQGQVICYVCDNTHDLTPAVLAGFFLETPINAIDTIFPSNEILHMFRIVQPKVVFCDDHVVHKVQTLLSELENDAKIFIIGKSVTGFQNIRELMHYDGDKATLQKFYFKPPSVEKESRVLISCSSGTTGLPKGVAIPHEFVIGPTMCQYKYLLDPDNYSFTFNTIYWMAGLLNMVYSILMSVPRIITTKRFSLEEWLKITKKYKIGVIFSSAHVTSEIYTNNTLVGKNSDIKIYISSGAVHPSGLDLKMRSYLSAGIFINGYGLTECGGIAILKEVSVGKTIGELSTGVEAKIIDDDGNQLGEEEIGELCVKTGNMFLGYWRNPEATREILDADGWLHTGDLASFNQNGYLVLAGRKKDMLKYKGMHISAAELEEIIQNHPKVKDVAVIGIPDPICTDLPAAVVVKESNADVSEEEIILLVESKVMDNKRLRGGVYFIQEMPRTPSGKIQKYKLKDMVTKRYKEKLVSV